MAARSRRSRSSAMGTGMRVHSGRAAFLLLRIDRQMVLLPPVGDGASFEADELTDLLVGQALPVELQNFGIMVLPG